MYIPCAQLHGPRARRCNPTHPGDARAQGLDSLRGGVEAIQGNHCGLKTFDDLGSEVRSEHTQFPLQGGPSGRG